MSYMVRCLLSDFRTFLREDERYRKVRDSSPDDLLAFALCIAINRLRKERKERDEQDMWNNVYRIS